MRTMVPLDMGNGFLDHGVAVPCSVPNGIVATVDGQGREVVLVWLSDHTGGYALLMIDAETGRSEQSSMPVAPGWGRSFPRLPTNQNGSFTYLNNQYVEFDAERISPGWGRPFASLLSSRNRFYTHFNSQFVEFDPVKRDFSFACGSAPMAAMSMTEDDSGRIWVVTFPDSGVMCFDPATREFRDFGHVHKQNWKQYPRSVAADDTGWIYFSVGFTSSQIVMLDPVTGQAYPVLSEAERKPGMAHVYRGENGRVYGVPREGDQEGWWEFYKGKAVKLVGAPPKSGKHVITGCQGLFHREFPSGRRIVSVDLTGRKLVTARPDEAPREVTFDYSSDGALLMGVMAASGASLCGAAAFPMRCFQYVPDQSAWQEYSCCRQWNTMARDGGQIFIGAYTQGVLLEWDTSKPWVKPEGDGADSNPVKRVACEPAINRPHSLLVHPDGKTIVMGGSPEYGCTGGGLLVWNRETKGGILLRHTDILPELMTMSLLALPDDQLLGGTSTRPGSGGERKAQEAELYVMDMTALKLNWHQAVFPGAQEYSDLCWGPGGLVYGLVDMQPWDPLVLEYAKRFFVFDPVARRIVHVQDTEAEFGRVGYQQGPRKLIQGEDGLIYMLFLNCVAYVDPQTNRLVRLVDSPIPMHTGGEVLNGRLYFACGSHLYSVSLPALQGERA